MQLGKMARWIKSFVENPVTNLIKGIILLVIGISDASQTFRDDMTYGHLRVGHGLIIIGLFGVLGAVPHLLDGLQATAESVPRRDRTGRLGGRRGPQ